MRIYYLDEPLSNDELTFVTKSVLEKDFSELVSVKLFEQIRVPGVWPAPNTNGKYKETSPEPHIALVRKNIQKAGIFRDVGKQVVWVMPKATYWGAIFQMAIFEETGYYPYVAQRWYVEDGESVKGDLRLIDGHGMMGGKE
ncbi:hypothetical protein FO488_13670 [Geobacter sp. FeAm09]|uniref:hypothetical protein n=1 Tax=Geobacter sp. FeAm09 TaxID=2597769 RepID=UPI0011EBFDD1|nr:hypothetical protein [Geobacter sp. FeAm09]QEM69106.1 hypothetical protein FO488_13670 [Geobacter sp. FeAm09]